MSYDDNPFPRDDSCRREIWEMLVRRDIDAYLSVDWAPSSADFIADGFFGVDAGKEAHPDNWRISFPDLNSYRDEWLRQAAKTRQSAQIKKARQALFEATDLRQIDITGNHACAHKKFDGYLPLADGGTERLHWQTLYICRRILGTWKIASFIGYMKY